MVVGGSPEANAAAMDRSQRANVMDLTDRFDTTAYLTGHSDIIALSLLAHQSDVHNLIGEASHAVRTAVRRETEASMDKGEEGHSRQTMAIVREMMEPLLQTLLFSGSAPLNATFKGSTEFASEFVTKGPFDSRGRSLRAQTQRSQLTEGTEGDQAWSVADTERRDPVGERFRWRPGVPILPPFGYDGSVCKLPFSGNSTLPS
jgi:hypothetical protein